MVRHGLAAGTIDRSQRPFAAMNQNIRFCTTPDGVQLAYAITGDGQPLVMSASWLTHLEHQWRSLAWRPWLDAFTREYKVLRADLRGCGLSDRDAGNLSFETWVRDLERVVEAAGFRRFALVATCWGGPIAIEYAARHPERVSRLVLRHLRGRIRCAVENRIESRRVERARMMLDLTRLGWGREKNHAFSAGVGIALSTGGDPGASCAPGATSSVPRHPRTRRCGCLRSVTHRRTTGCAQDQMSRSVAHPERDRIAPLEEGRALANLIPDRRFVQLDSETTCRLRTSPHGNELVAEVRRFLAEPECARANPPQGAAAQRDRPARACGARRIAEGLDNGRSPRSLQLSEKTVRNHITRVFDKIGVDDRYQAIVLARELVRDHQQPVVID